MLARLHNDEETPDSLITQFHNVANTILASKGGPPHKYAQQLKLIGGIVGSKPPRNLENLRSIVEDIEAKLIEWEEENGKEASGHGMNLYDLLDNYAESTKSPIGTQRANIPPSRDGSIIGISANGSTVDAKAPHSPSVAVIPDVMHSDSPPAGDLTKLIHIHLKALEEVQKQHRRLAYSDPNIVHSLQADLGRLEDMYKQSIQNLIPARDRYQSLQTTIQNQHEQIGRLNQDKSALQLDIDALKTKIIDVEREKSFASKLLETLFNENASLKKESNQNRDTYNNARENPNTVTVSDAHEQLSQSVKVPKRQPRKITLPDKLNIELDYGAIFSPLTAPAVQSDSSMFDIEALVEQCDNAKLARARSLDYPTPKSPIPIRPKPKTDLNSNKQDDSYKISKVQSLWKARRQRKRFRRISMCFLIYNLTGH